MKSLKQICEQLEPHYKDLIDGYKYHGETYEDSLSYEFFEKVMMKDGFILSDKTIIQKWKLLKSNNIIRMVGPGKALINGAELAKALDYTSYVEVKKIKKNFLETADTQEVDA